MPRSRTDLAHCDSAKPCRLSAQNEAICEPRAPAVSTTVCARNPQGAFITGRHLPCRKLKSREVICRYIALAADPDGTFAIARMQPCFQVAVKIATVVAARLKGGFHVGRLASTAAWAGLA